MKSLLIFALLGYLSCQPRLDLISDETYEESKQRVRASLTESQLERFDRTIKRFDTVETNRHWRVDQNIDQPEDRQAVLDAEVARMDELRRSHLHGKTADQLRGEPRRFIRRLWLQQRNWEAEWALESVPVAREYLAPLRVIDVALVDDRLEVRLNNGTDIEMVEVELRVVGREQDFEMSFRYKFDSGEPLKPGAATVVSTPFEVPPAGGVDVPELEATVERVWTSDGKALGIPTEAIRRLTTKMTENLEQHSYLTRLRQPPAPGDGDPPS